MILSIETATDLCGAALVEGGVCVAERTVAEKNIHSERLMVLVDELLREADTPVASLAGIAVSIGPGSFTGLRIGLSAAKGLAYAQSLPLLAVPTLDALAQEALRQHAAAAGDIVCPLIDAKRDEAYYAFYRVGQAEDGADTHAEAVLRVHSISSYAIASAAAIADEAAKLMGEKDEAGRIVFVGDGTKKIAPFAAQIARSVMAGVVVCSPAAVGLAAERRFNELRVADFAELEPAYIRDFVTTAPRVANQKAIT